MKAVLRTCLVLAIAASTTSCAGGPDPSAPEEVIGVCKEALLPEPPPCDEPAPLERLSRR